MRNASLSNLRASSLEPVHRSRVCVTNAPTGLTSVAPPGPGAPFRSLSVVVAERDPSTTTGRSPTSPTPIDPLLESADAESTIRTFYSLFESYLPYMPLADTLESLARGTLSELVLTCMHMLVKRSVHQARERELLVWTTRN